VGSSSARSSPTRWIIEQVFAVVAGAVLGVSPLVGVTLVVVGVVVGLVLGLLAGYVREARSERARERDAR